MIPKDRVSAIADRIADGSAIDWPADVSATDPDEWATLEALKAIAALATLHRRPLDFSPNATAPEGTPWGPLTITSQIGAGRFGQVYLAWDARLQRRVALKLLFAESPAAFASPAHAIEEARLLARVRHPNVLAVHGAECIEGQIGIWTEFIEGRTLEDLLDQHGPMPPADVVSIGLDLCRALGAVHDAGLLHRDIKLQNVMRETGGRIVLMDFGTGHDLEARPTRAGDLSGTPLYLAPEILAGGEATPASDVYALAVLLFRLLTDEYPVPGRTLDDVQSRHRLGGAARLRDARPDLAIPLIDAIDRGLASDPAQRHPSASTFEGALTQAQKALVVPPAVNTARPGRAAHRRLAGRLVVGAAALALVAVGAWTLNFAGVGQPTTLKKVRLPPFAMGRASGDGRYLPYLDNAGDLNVWERSTGGSVRVTGPGAAGGTILGSVMSPTGDRVAYGFRTADEGWELRAVNVDGTWPSVLLARQTAFNPVPIEWSRDGLLILCRLDQRDGSTDLVLVGATNGSPRVVHVFRADEPKPAHPTLSPDGSFVVYDIQPDGRSRRDLFIVAVDGSVPRLLLGGDTNDTFPIWTPDGRSVFFLRDSTQFPSESQDGWALPILNGFAMGDPRLVVSNLGPVSGLTLTQGGALFYEHFAKSADVYTLSVDLTGAGAHGAPTRISAHSIGQHVAPSWSPDGQSIAYMTTRESPGFGNPLRTLTILDMRTGRETYLSPDIPVLGGYAPRWFPDGRSVIVWGWTTEPQVFSYFRVNVRTSETSTVVTDVAPRPDSSGYFECSSDGRFVYLNQRGIVARDLATGGETVIVPIRADMSLSRFGLSPDGRSIAFIATTNKNTVSTLQVQILGERARQLAKASLPDRLLFQAWTPNGHDVLYATWSGSRKTPPTLWRVPAAGGERRDMLFGIVGNVTNPFSLNVDGRRLAYPERDDNVELWVRERFWDDGVFKPSRQ